MFKNSILRAVFPLLFATCCLLPLSANAKTPTASPSQQLSQPPPLWQSYQESIRDSRSPVEALAAYHRLTRLLNRTPPADASTALKLIHQQVTDPLLRFIVAQGRSSFEVAYRQLDQHNNPAPLNFNPDWEKEYGCVTTWQVTGPFNNPYGEGMNTRLAPETEKKQPLQFAAKHGNTSWRTINSAKHQQCITNLALFYDTDQAVFFAEARLESPKTQPILLSVGSEAAVQVWLNGTSIGALSQPHGSLQENDLWNARLNKGTNRITLKLGTDSLLPARFLVRILDPKTLNPLPVLPPSDSTPPSPNTENQLLASPDPSIQPSQHGWIARFHNAIKQINKGKFKPYSALLIALMLKDIEYKKREAPWNELLDRYCETPKATSIELALCSQAMTQTWKQLAVIQKAVQRLTGKDPNADFTVRRLAAEIQSHEPRLLDQSQARQLLEQLHKDRPTDPYVIELLADLYQQQQAPGLALNLLRQIPLHTATSAQRSIRRELEDQIGDPRIVDQIDAIDHATQPLAAHVAISYARDKAMQGDFSAAFKRLDAAQTNQPNEPLLEVTRAQLLRSQGDSHAAVATLARLYSVYPINDWVRDAYVNTLLSTNDTETALEVLRQTQKTKPQDETIRRWIAELEPKSEPFYSQFVVHDLPNFAQQYPPKPFPSDTVVDQSVVFASKNGLTRVFRQIVARVNTTEGIAQAKSARISYQMGDESPEIVAVKVYKPDGRTTENFEKDWGSNYRKQNTTYSDIGYLYVAAQDVEVGDLVEFQWTISQVANENFRGDYFGDIAFLQSNQPIAFERYTILYPPSFTLHFRNPSLPFMRLDDTYANYHASISKDQKPSDSLKDLRITSFELYQVPEVENEQMTVGPSELYDYILVSNKGSWNDIGTWWWELIKEQLIVDKHIRSKVQELIKDLKTDDEKIAAIQDYIAKNTRYLHVGLGVHGWKPYKTTDIFRNRYGDCKDKSILLKVMLEEAGIPTQLVLVRTRNLGKITDEPASMHIFNHAIAYVPSKSLFIDGTAEFNGLHELTPMDQGAQGLIIQDGGASTLVELPIDKPHVNHQELQLDIHINGDQTTVTGTFTLAGNLAPPFRSSFQDVKRRNETLETLLSSLYNGLSITSSSFTPMTDLNQPVTITFSATGGSFVHQNGSSSTVYPKGHQTSFSNSYTPTATRKHPLFVGTPNTMRTIIHWTPPAGSSFGTLPPPTELTSPYGQFQIRYSRDDKQVTSESTLTLSKQTVSPSEYSNFREFIRKVDLAFNTPIPITSD